MAQAATLLGMRYSLAAALLLAAGVGCDSPRLVDCAPPMDQTRDHGRFVRLEDSVWCVYPERSNADCPISLPEEHRLPWGGFGCAEERFEDLPPALCAAAGECDAAADGGA